MFPVELTSVLSGASLGQLQRWRAEGLLPPEGSERPVRYSFRDVVALRTMMKLRTDLSFQKVRRAFTNLPVYQFTQHPAEYRFGTDGKSIAVLDEEQWMDLTRNPGQYDLFTMAQVFQGYTTKSGREVVDFTKPRKNLRVNGALMGGWPTIIGTRVGYDTVASLVADGSLTAADVHHFYPTVPIEAVADAVELADLVSAIRNSAA
jgi:uncharacterized protein (DUF433 family)